MKLEVPQAIQDAAEHIRYHAIEYAIVAIIAALLFVLVLGEKQKQEMRPQQYAAWCKLTGNEKQMTYEEWLMLERLEEEKRTSTVHVTGYLAR